MESRRYCSCPVQCINSKGAILMIWVSIAVFIYANHVDNIYTLLNIECSPVFLYLTSTTFFIFVPLYGWIADAWIGRYRAILYGLYFLVIGCMLLTVSVIIKDLQPLVSQSFLYASNVVYPLGLLTMYANTLPFVTDQMIGASGDELSAAVHWVIWSGVLPVMIVLYEPCLLQGTPFIVMSFFVSFFGLAIALSSLFLCQHWLDKTPQITNPIKHIIKVLNYARKNKYPRNRSALTYWEQEVPTRLDLGKDKYGGPFSEEEVENVKTTLRLMPVIFILSMIGTATPVMTFQQKHMTVNSNKILACFLDDGDNIIEPLIGFGIPLYHFILRPLLKKTTKYSLSMLTIIGACFFFQLLGTVGMVIIETIGHLQTPNVTCMFDDTINEVMSLNYYWTMIPQVLEAFGTAVFYLAFFEFVIAQSPCEMKGFLFGICFSFNGIAKIFGMNLYHPFQFLPVSIPISCGFYYYLTQSLLLSLLFIIFLILSKQYKLRMRNNPVNIHMIAETHITAYINQEEEYRREIGLDNESVMLLSHSTSQYGATTN